MIELEVIIDYGSEFVTYGKITGTKSSRKESSFPAEVPLIKVIEAANLQSPVIARKISAFASQEHHIRKLSDEREKERQPRSPGTSKNKSMKILGKNPRNSALRYRQVTRQN